MDFTQYIQPELLILIPALCCIGVALKRAEWLDNKHIPVSLGVIGICLAALWVVATTTISSGQECALAVFTAVVQGILCAAGAVYAYNVYKQNKTKG